MFTSSCPSCGGPALTSGYDHYPTCPTRLNYVVPGVSGGTVSFFNSEEIQTINELECRLANLQAECRKLKAWGEEQYRENREYRRALGLVSTLAPHVVVAGDHPMEWMQEVVNYVQRMFELHNDEQSVWGGVVEEERKVDDTINRLDELRHEVDNKWSALYDHIEATEKELAYLRAKNRILEERLEAIMSPPTCAPPFEAKGPIPCNRCGGAGMFAGAGVELPCPQCVGTGWM